MKDGSSRIAVQILNRQTTGALDKKHLKAYAAFVLQNEWEKSPRPAAIHETGVSLEFTVHVIEEKEMIRRHEESHGLKTPTDVITYDYFDGCDGGSGEWVLGETFLSVTAAVQAARRLGTTVNDELVLYMVHGILHCFGYDDQNREDRDRMRGREAFYMNLLRLALPVFRKGAHSGRAPRNP